MCTIVSWGFFNWGFEEWPPWMSEDKNYSCPSSISKTFPTCKIWWIYNIRFLSYGLFCPENFTFPSPLFDNRIIFPKICLVIIKIGKYFVFGQLGLVDALAIWWSVLQKWTNFQQFYHKIKSVHTLTFSMIASRIIVQLKQNTQSFIISLLLLHYENKNFIYNHQY